MCCIQKEFLPRKGALNISHKMPIEIKQLLIKSSIVQRTADESLDGYEERSALKEELLTECRHLIRDILREKEER